MKKRYIVCCIGALLIVLIVLMVKFISAKSPRDPYAGMEVYHFAKSHDYGPYYSYNTLQEIEDAADIIIEAKVGDITGPKLTQYYSAEFYNHMPTDGYTEKEIKVTKVHKGDVKAGDKLIFAERYYVWITAEEEQVIVSDAYVKPAVEGEKYLLFLKYNEKDKNYSLVADYMSFYEFPSKSLLQKTKDGTLVQEDLTYLYQEKKAINFYPLYKEVIDKYFQ